MKDDSSSKRSSATSSTSSSDASDNLVRYTRVSEHGPIKLFLRSSANQKSPKSRAEFCADSLRAMNPHDMIAMLEMYAQHADNDMAFDVFQKVKNSSHEEERRQVAWTGKKKRSFFPSFGRTLNA